MLQKVDVFQLNHIIYNEFKFNIAMMQFLYFKSVPANILKVLFYCGKQEKLKRVDKKVNARRLCT